MKERFRIEEDSMGKKKVPADVYYGIHTERAVENFKISGITFPLYFIHTLAMIKAAAARANMKLGLLDAKLGETILKVSAEVRDGKFDDYFPIDIFQTGSGTSTNMNINEVISNRANELLGADLGTKAPVHPNDHLNMGQSSNDIIPTAIHITAYQLITERLLPALLLLKEKLAVKSNEFENIVKLGRTHLQDAAPVTLGQEFGGYARQIELGIKRLVQAQEELLELAIGGTAVGTGLNTDKDFAGLVIEQINSETGYSFSEAENHFEAQSSKDGVVEVSGALRGIAVSLIKILNDLRWMSSGQGGGLGEIIISPILPGSSIMPGKINPVIIESVLQASIQVIGNDSVIAYAGAMGNFELNTMMPLIAYNIFQSIELLANGTRNLAEKAVQGIKADSENCLRAVEKSLALITPLAVRIGYDRAGAIAKKASSQRRTLRDVLQNDENYSENEVDEILNPGNML